jgi:hypothetical protein
MIDEFNKTVDEFLDALSKILPNDPRISLYKKSIQFAKMMGTSHLDVFMTKLEPYEAQIFSKNDDFFVKEQTINGVTNISFDLGINELWPTLDEHVQNTIWEYFQILYVMCYNTLGKDMPGLLSRIAL